MKKTVFYLIFLLVVFTSCKRNKDVLHIGKDYSKTFDLVLEWDSLTIDIFNTSGIGDFFMRDSVISFADHQYARIYNYSCNTGDLLSYHLGLGNGPNELQKFLYANTIQNDTSVFIVNNNIEFFLCGNDYLLERKGLMNFGWKNRYTGEYDSPEVYNFMLTTDFGVNVYKYDDDRVIIPIQPLIYYACENEIVTRKHYKKSHILGLLNLKTMEVDSVFGRYPKYYHEHLLPHIDYFSYLYSNNELIVSFAVDSLIYVYEYPDKLLYTFGYECKDIVRDYTESSRLTNDLYKDFIKTGISTEILNFPETGFFFRTYIKNMQNTSFGMQIYNRSYDLLADVEVPKYFKLLGYFDSCYYGITFVPEETDENTYITIYKIKIL